MPGGIRKGKNRSGDHEAGPRMREWDRGPAAAASGTCGDSSLTAPRNVIRESAVAFHLDTHDIMAIQPGTPAPDFSLAPAPGPDRVSLSDFRGEQPVVVLFFPLAFSGGCTRELCSIADDWSNWNELDAAVVGISVDSPFVNQKFKDETGVPFPLLSDFNKEAATAYDVLYEEFFGMHGVSKRSAFVIDRDGVVRYSWVTEDAGVMPPMDDVKQAVAAL